MYIFYQNMNISNDIKLDFNDVLIKPKKSSLKSRSEVNLIREFHFPNTDQVWKGIPIIASNMDSIGTLSMYNSLKNFNILTCFHKFLDEYPENDRNLYSISVGIHDKDYEKLKSLYIKSPEKCNIICIDVANGYMKELIIFCQKVRELFPNSIIIAGNVVTSEETIDLILNGKVDIVKVGIGSGSVCTTRTQTGVGMPQLSAIIECSDAAHKVGGYIISDGGITNSGDASKAFGAGADFIMLGSILAGHKENEKTIIINNAKKYVEFYGMSSINAMEKYYGGVDDYRSVEGKIVLVEYKGNVENTIKDLLGGIRSTLTYTNSKNIQDLPKNTYFYRVNNIKANL